MKRLAVNKAAKCMSCLTCEIACAMTFYKTYERDLSCVRITADRNGGGGKPSVCIQCGKCARECPAVAISRLPSGVYMISKSRCVGCGRCAEVCPMRVVAFGETSARATKCIACGICAKACPMAVLRLTVDS